MAFTIPRQQLEKGGSTASRLFSQTVQPTAHRIDPPVPAARPSSHDLVLGQLSAVEVWELHRVERRAAAAAKAEQAKQLRIRKLEAEKRAADIAALVCHEQPCVRVLGKSWPVQRLQGLQAECSQVQTILSAHAKLFDSVSPYDMQLQSAKLASRKSVAGVKRRVALDLLLRDRRGL